MTENIRYVTKVIINHLWKDEQMNIEWALHPDVNILAGDNGSGKSTILKIIAFLLNAHEENKEKEASITQLALTALIKINSGHSRILGSSKDNTSTNIHIFADALAPLCWTINTFDQQLKDSDSVKRLSNEKVKTDLDWQLYQLEKNYLDYQVNIGKRALESLSHNNGKRPDSAISQKINLFWDTIDHLFGSTNKKIDRSKNSIAFLKNDKTVLEPHQLSSGEKQMLLILLSALIQDNQYCVMIMDEPEVSLHPDWQESLIDHIKALNPNAQIIIATHSPSIIVNGWKDKVFEVSDLLVQGNKHA